MEMDDGSETPNQRNLMDGISSRDYREPDFEMHGKKLYSNSNSAVFHKLNLFFGFCRNGGEQPRA